MCYGCRIHESTNMGICVCHTQETIESNVVYWIMTSYYAGSHISTSSFSPLDSFVWLSLFLSLDSMVDSIFSSFSGLLVISMGFWLLLCLCASIINIISSPLDVFVAILNILLKNKRIKSPRKTIERKLSARDVVKSLSERKKHIHKSATTKSYMRTWWECGTEGEPRERTKKVCVHMCFHYEWIIFNKITSEKENKQNETNKACARLGSAGGRTAEV